MLINTNRSMYQTRLQPLSYRRHRHLSRRFSSRNPSHVHLFTRTLLGVQILRPKRGNCPLSDGNLTLGFPKQSVDLLNRPCTSPLSVTAFVESIQNLLKFLHSLVLVSQDSFFLFGRREKSKE